MGADDIKALTGVKNKYFPDMKEWIKDYISAFAEKVGGASNTRLQCVNWLLHLLTELTK